MNVRGPMKSKMNLFQDFNNHLIKRSLFSLEEQLSVEQ